MSMPTPHTVGWHVRTNTGTDRFRDPPTYSPPSTSPGTSVAVIGWAPAGSSPGAQPLGHDREVIEVDLYVPPEFDPNPGDLIDLPAGPQGQFQVQQRPGDFNHGFHGWRPGSVVRLHRVEG